MKGCVKQSAKKNVWTQHHQAKTACRKISKKGLGKLVVIYDEI